ncbi:hypothetical protein PI124_g4701 [Phytophthora idaei]|nr:hypothetical protein PI124_g4701 [Phytophthora idaei]
MWLYSTGMAFNKAAHPALASAVQERTPTEVVPSRKQLATTLLNSCYYEARSANVLKLRGKKYTVVTDAWMDNNGQSVIYYVALDEELAIFLESDYSGSISHDALYLAGDIRRVMGNRKELIGTQVRPLSGTQPPPSRICREAGERSL